MGLSSGIGKEPAPGSRCMAVRSVARFENFSTCLFGPLEAGMLPR